MSSRLSTPPPSLLSRFKHTALGEQMVNLYRRSGLKARLVLRSVTLPVPTVEPRDFLQADPIGPVPRPAVMPSIELPDHYDGGPMPEPDAIAFADFLCRFAPQRILEFGTNWGVTTAMCLLNTPAHIWTVDLGAELLEASEPDPGAPSIATSNESEMVLPQEKVGWAYRRIEGHADRVTQIFRDSLRLDWTETRDYPETFDLILVDACHLYDYVKSDTGKALQRLAPGGVLVWHDFAHDTVFFPGVYRFVSEFARLHPGVVHLRGTQLAMWRKSAQG